LGEVTADKSTEGLDAAAISTMDELPSDLLEAAEADFERQ
jgi:hypothetical protein